MAQPEVRVVEEPVESANDQLDVHVHEIMKELAADELTSMHEEHNAKSDVLREATEAAEFQKAQFATETEGETQAVVQNLQKKLYELMKKHEAELAEVRAENRGRERDLKLEMKSRLGASPPNRENVRERVVSESTPLQESIEKGFIEAPLMNAIRQAKAKGEAASIPWGGVKSPNKLGKTRQERGKRSPVKTKLMAAPSPESPESPESPVPPMTPKKWIKEGKLAKLSSGLVQSWNRHTFKLYGGAFWYVRENGKNSDWKMSLDNGDVNIRHDDKRCFEVSTPSKTLLLKARTVAECTKWVDTLLAAIEDHRSTNSPVSASKSSTSKAKEGKLPPRKASKGPVTAVKADEDASTSTDSDEEAGSANSRNSRKSRKSCNSRKSLEGLMRWDKKGSLKLKSGRVTWLKYTFSLNMGKFSYLLDNGKKSDLIFLMDDSIVNVRHDDPRCFEIINRDNSAILRATSQEDASDWIEALLGAGKALSESSKKASETKRTKQDPSRNQDLETESNPVQKKDSPSKEPASHHDSIVKAIQRGQIKAKEKNPRRKSVDDASAQENMLSSGPGLLLDSEDEDEAYEAAPSPINSFSALVSPDKTLGSRKSKPRRRSLDDALSSIFSPIEPVETPPGSPVRKHGVAKFDGIDMLLSPFESPSKSLSSPAFGPSPVSMGGFGSMESSVFESRAAINTRVIAGADRLEQLQTALDHAGLLLSDSETFSSDLQHKIEMLEERNRVMEEIMTTAEEKESKQADLSELLVQRQTDTAFKAQERIMMLEKELWETQAVVKNATDLYSAAEESAELLIMQVEAAEDQIASKDEEILKLKGDAEVQSKLSDGYKSQIDTNGRVGELVFELENSRAHVSRLDRTVQKQSTKIEELLLEVENVERDLNGVLGKERAESKSNLAMMKTKEALMTLVRGETGMRLMLWRTRMKADKVESKRVLCEQIRTLEKEIQRLSEEAQVERERVIESDEAKKTLSVTSEAMLSELNENRLKITELEQEVKSLQVGSSGALLRAEADHMQELNKALDALKTELRTEHALEIQALIQKYSAEADQTQERHSKDMAVVKEDMLSPLKEGMNRIKQYREARIQEVFSMFDHTSAGLIKKEDFFQIGKEMKMKSDWNKAMSDSMFAQIDVEAAGQVTTSTFANFFRESLMSREDSAFEEGLGKFFITAKQLWARNAVENVKSIESLELKVSNGDRQIAAVNEIVLALEVELESVEQEKMHHMNSRASRLLKENLNNNLKGDLGMRFHMWRDNMKRDLIFEHETKANRLKDFSQELKLELEEVYRRLEALKAELTSVTCERNEIKESVQMSKRSAAEQIDRLEASVARLTHELSIAKGQIEFQELETKEYKIKILSLDHEIEYKSKIISDLDFKLEEQIQSFDVMERENRDALAAEGVKLASSHTAMQKHIMKRLFESHRTYVHEYEVELPQALLRTWQQSVSTTPKLSPGDAVSFLVHDPTANEYQADIDFICFYRDLRRSVQLTIPEDVSAYTYTGLAHATSVGLLSVRTKWMPVDVRRGIVWVHEMCGMGGKIPPKVDNDAHENPDGNPDGGESVSASASHDSHEDLVLTLEYNTFFVIMSGLEKNWDEAFNAFVDMLDSRKPVVVIIAKPHREESALKEKLMLLQDTANLVDLTVECNEKVINGIGLVSRSLQKMRLPSKEGLEDCLVTLICPSMLSLKSKAVHEAMHMSRLKSDQRASKVDLGNRRPLARSAFN